MSTLGRRAMKRTLERLKKDAIEMTRPCLRFFKKKLKDYDNMSEAEKRLFDFLFAPTVFCIDSLMKYVKALEDYGYELDEEWDKLLKSIEKTQQSKPVQKKMEAEKTSYIK